MSEKLQKTLKRPVKFEDTVDENERGVMSAFYRCYVLT